MNSLKPYFRNWLINSKNTSKFLVSVITIVLLLSSCATRRIEIRYYEGSLNDRLRSFEDIRSLKADLSIEFDRGDGIPIKGEGILNLSEGDLDLQVYSMGFLVAEVNADRTGIRSDPSINKNRLSMLVDGLRGSFFWWAIKGYDIKDEGDNYIMVNSWKRVIINKKTIMPINQTIELEDGKQLEVFYYEPSDMNGFVFPSRIRIEFDRYAVNLRIKDISVVREPVH